MSKVGLMLIGAQKAGTTSLYQYLLQHPQIEFSSVKEITYFIDSALYARGEDYYHAFFTEGLRGEVVAGVHVHMLPSDDAPARVYAYNPKMKLVVLLREPMARAWSAFNYAVQNGWEASDTGILESMELEDERRRSRDHRQIYDLAYFYNGLYWRHLSRWLRYFPREQFLILKSSDLRNDPQATLARAWEFLEVSDSVYVDTSREFNKAGRVRWQWINKIRFSKTSRFKSALRALLPGKVGIWIRSRVLPAVSRMNTVETAPIEPPAEFKAVAERYFRGDLEKLDRDFSIRFN